MHIRGICLTSYKKQSIIQVLFKIVFSHIYDFSAFRSDHNNDGRCQFYQRSMIARIPKLQKDTVKLSLFFALSGSSSRMLMQLTLEHKQIMEKLVKQDSELASLSAQQQQILIQQTIQMSKQDMMMKYVDHLFN